MAVANSFTRLLANAGGPSEEAREWREASGSAPTCPVREYSARNWSTERIKIVDAAKIGCGGEVRVAAAEEAMVVSSGADVTGRLEASGCGCSGGPVAIIVKVVAVIGEVVAMIGEVVAMIGEVVVVIGEVIIMIGGVV